MLCPFCNEEIKDGAKKCRFCGEFLEKESESQSDEVKVYGMISGLIITNVIFGLLGLVFYGLGIILLCVAWSWAKWKLEIHSDCVVIKHGIITKKKEEIPYTKINSVDTENTLGFVNLVIRTGNDKPTIFKYIQKHDEVVSEIRKHLKTN